jgi:hypothetical protein
VSNRGRLSAFLLLGMVSASLSSCSNAARRAGLSMVLSVSGGAGAVAPEVLLDLIRDYQRREVRLSVGKMENECFTDLDLQDSVRRGRPVEVARAVRSTKRLAAVVRAVAAMPEQERVGLLLAARGFSHPTWAQQGRVTTDGSGQTNAGRSAELLLAGAIVDALEQALRQHSGGPGAAFSLRTAHRRIAGVRRC